MANPPKKKGTAAETAVVRWLRAHGFPHADRQPLRGNRDAGDVAACPGLVLEVKVRATAGTGQPPAALLAEWMSQAAAERDAAGADLCPLVVKRAGTADVGRWFAYVTADELGRLISAEVDMPDPSAPMSTSVASLVGILRAAGYGDPLEAVAS